MSTLEQQISAFNQDIRAQIPADDLKAIDQATGDLKKLKLEDNSLKTGDKVPDFTLLNHKGLSRTFFDILSESPVVLTFYRGEWCPYCNLEFAALQKSLAEIEQLGAKLVAISPELPDHSLTMSEKHKLGFEILSDQGGSIQRQFGLEFQLPEELRPIYANFGFDIPGHNGNDSFVLPVPATYIIDQAGVIQYHFVDVDYTKRSEPAAIIEKLKTLAFK